MTQLTTITTFSLCCRWFEDCLGEWGTSIFIAMSGESPTPGVDCRDDPVGRGASGSGQVTSLHSYLQNDLIIS